VVASLRLKMARLLRFWREPVHSRRTRLALKVDNIPVDATGKPDLSGYVDTATTTPPCTIRRLRPRG
jgi:hypothetical protein